MDGLLYSKLSGAANIIDFRMLFRPTVLFFAESLSWELGCETIFSADYFLLVSFLIIICLAFSAGMTGLNFPGFSSWL